MQRTRRSFPARRALPWPIALAAVAPCAAGSTPTDANEPPPPRLVVLLVVDQLRPDYLERFAAKFDGFFADLARDGRWFTDAEQHHALTVTAPGHASLGTGRFPAHHGIVGNEFFDPAEKRIVAAVEDRSARPLAGAGGGCSAARLRTDGLGDWWRRAHPQGKVVGISLKPRSALLPLGQGPHLAFWFDDESGVFASSDRCMEALPDWAATAAAADPLRELPDQWERRLADDDYAALGCTGDDEPGEAPTGRPPTRTFPHGLAAFSRSSRAAALAVSPYGDRLVLDFARAAVAGEALGADASADLLVLGLSATDLIGHRHGPDSWEIAEQLVALDRALAEFATFLAARVDPAGLLFALTSDHGIPPLPEVATARGAPGDRLDWTALGPLVDRALVAIDPALAGAALPLPGLGLRLDR
ncbi:MAG: hypothetical protein FJ293_13265, partial [Planctomycetes bacterium]|nr:hypothetical protein [Planctomycetota bacterium]